MSICNKCRVQDYAPCPVLEVMYDSGVDEAKIRKCKVKDYFDKVFEMLQNTVKHSEARK